MQWAGETLSYREAQALSERRRAAGKAIGAGAQLAEVRDRDRRVKQVQRQQQQKPDAVPVSSPTLPPASTTSADTAPIASPTTEPLVEVEKPKKPVPYVRVLDYEQMKCEAGLL